MNVYQRFHNATHFAAATGIVLYSLFAGAPGMGIIGVGFVLLAWRLFRTRTKSPVPRPVINTLLVLASIAMFLRVVTAPHDAIVILAEYLVVLLLIKLFEHRTPRDQAQSLSICAMLGVGAVLSAVQMWVGVMLLIHLCAMLIAATRYQLWAGHHATFAPNAEPADAPVHIAPSAGRHSRRRLSAVTLLLACTIAVGSVMVFVTLPRRMSRPGDANFNFTDTQSVSMVSGFRDHVQLGVSGLLSESREVVAHVEILMDDAPLTQPVLRYFRGVTLDRYDLRRGSWERSEALKSTNRARILSHGDFDEHGSFRNRGRDALPIAEPAGYPAGVRYLEQRFEIVNKTSPNLFALPHPAQISYVRSTAILLNPIDRTMQMLGRQGRIEYRVLSAIDYALPALDEEVAEYERRRADDADPFAGGMVGNRLRTLANGIMAEEGLERAFDAPPGPDDERIVRAFEDYLGRECAYTREIVAPDNQSDPTLFFLFDVKQGHCEYFASALAGLCRSVGIDARVVTGFATSEVDDSGRYVVRQSHAHAWVEAPVLVDVAFRAEEDSDGPLQREERVLWRTFDPSPQEMVGGFAEAGNTWTDRVRLWMYRFEDMWVRSVVDYDAESQKKLLGVSGDEQMAELGGWFERLNIRPVAFFQGAPVWMQRLFAPTLAIIGCVVVALAIRRWPVKPEVAQRRMLDAATRRRVNRIDRALSRAGHRRPAYRALLEHAGHIGGGVGDALSRVAALLYAQRFGAAPADHQAINSAIVRLERASRARGRS